MKQYVVEAYMQGDADFPFIYLTQTLPITEEYTYEKAAIDSAEITIYELDVFYDKVDSVEYRRSVNFNGIYGPRFSQLVKPNTFYQLEVVIPNDNNHKITARTFVPGPFESLSSNADTVVYQSQEQLDITYSKSEYPGRQSYYILTVVAQDTTNELTPFFARVTEDGTPPLSELQKNSSGILNESNFTVNPDNSVTIRLPWLAVAFYGEHEIWAHTIDDNIYDFNRSRDVQFGGSTVSPGEIYDVLDHVDGGTGVFGSYYKITSDVFIKKGFTFPK